MEIYARDRNRWKNQIKIRMVQIREWEEQMARKHRDNEQEVENVTGNRKRNSIRESLRCDWEHCGRLCKTKAGLVWPTERKQWNSTVTSVVNLSAVMGLSKIMKSSVKGYQEAHALTASKC